MKGSAQAAREDARGGDLYDGDHGRYVLFNSPGQAPMTILPFAPVSYDRQDGRMKAKDPARAEDFIDISGSKMR
jgi:3'-phosphoadenosine 5'-phosphosulfate synthase